MVFLQPTDTTGKINAKQLSGTRAVRQTRLSPVMTLDLELSPMHTKESIFQKGMLNAFCTITRKLRGFF